MALDRTSPPEGVQTPTYAATTAPPAEQATAGDRPLGGAIRAKRHEETAKSTRRIHLFKKGPPH